MANKRFIAQAIINRVENSQGSKYSDWRIGITNDPEDRKAEWNYPKYWQQWQADSLKDAQEIETFFIHEKRMQGGTGGNLSPYRSVHVYIF